MSRATTHTDIYQIKDNFEEAIKRKLIFVSIAYFALMTQMKCFVTKSNLMQQSL